MFEVRQSELDREIRSGATNEFGFNENRGSSSRGRYECCFCCFDYSVLMYRDDIPL